MGERLWGVGGPHAAAIFAEGDVAVVEQAVFDVPMAAREGQQFDRAMGLSASTTSPLSGGTASEPPWLKPCGDIKPLLVLKETLRIRQSINPRCGALNRPGARTSKPEARTGFACLPLAKARATAARIRQAPGRA